MMRIAVTGGSGKLGRTVVAGLREAGHEVLNVDVAGTRGPGFLRVDLTNYGEVIDTLFGENDTSAGPDQASTRGLVGSGRGVVLAEQRVDDLAVVGQVHPQEARAARTGDVDVEDLVSGLAQASDNRAPQLARPTRDSDLHHLAPRGSPVQRAVSPQRVAAQGSRRVTTHSPRGQPGARGRSRPAGSVSPRPGQCPGRAVRRRAVPGCGGQ